MTTPASGSQPGPGQGVRSFDQLMARQADAALALSGAHHSSWRRGQLGPTRKVDHGIVLGTADWDGTLRYDYERVVKPLQEMFTRPREDMGPADLVKYRSALLVVLHENAHMLAPQGRDNGDERDTPLNPDAARKALEEGATEAWAYRNLDRYVDALGLEPGLAAGLKSVTAISRYQQYMPAADVLAERIGERSGLGRDEVLRQLNNTLSDGKWPVAVELMYQNSDLPGLVPPGNVRQVKREIDAAMRSPLRSLTELGTVLPVTSRAAKSAALGEAAYYEGLRAISGLEEQYRSGTGPSLQQDRSTPTQGRPEPKDVLAVAFSGTAPAGLAVTSRPNEATLKKAQTGSPAKESNTREPT